MASVYLWWKERALNSSLENHYPRIFKDSDYLTRRLARSSILTGHHGCVNSVAWTESGSHLLSGSDDCHLNIYDTSQRSLLVSVHSTHRSNIFSTKFLPSYDFKCVSCAGLGSVEFSEISPSGEYLGHTFNCQNSITYQVATMPSDPNEFLTCEEKGNVRVFDLRVKSSCPCDGCDKDVLYSFEKGVTCMSVHPLSPYYLAVGLGDGTTCVMDRRMGGVRNVNGAITTITPRHLAEQSTHQQYRPDFSMAKPFKITCAQFNPTGSELLVSYSEDYVYLYNSSQFGCGGTQAVITPPLYHSHCYSTHKTISVTQKAPHSVCGSKQEGPSEETSDFVPPMKRLRLRGDWSDTGPEARPNDRENSNRSNFMTRMSRMFSRWIDEGLSSRSSQQESHEHQQSREHQETASEPSTPPNSLNSSSDSFRLFSETDSSSMSHSPHSGTPTSTLSTAMASCSTASPLESQQNHEEDELYHTAPGPQAVSAADQTIGDLPSVTQDHAARSEEERAATSLLRNRPPTATTIPSISYMNTSTDSVPDQPSDGHHDVAIRTMGAATPIVDIDTSFRRGHPHQLQDQSNHEIDLLPHRLTVPKICIMEGESDSDDMEEQPEAAGECEVSHVKQESDEAKQDSGLLKKPEEEQCRRYRRPYMVYKGHRNARTMIKQACFWGEQYIMSGSDCGRVFVWDKWSGEVVNLLVGDSHVVNCVQPHPTACLLATSGIDYDIKLWEPLASEFCTLDGLADIIDRNEIMLQESRNTITVPSSFIIHVLTYLNRRRRVRGDLQEGRQADDSGSE